MSNGVKVTIEVDIRVEPDEDSFHAYCPALKGLHTCGDTEEEALNNAIDATIAYIHSLIKHGDSIPVGIMIEAEERAPLYRKGRLHHIKDLVVATA